MTFRRTLAAALLGVASAAAIPAFAADLYWDTNGTTANGDGAANFQNGSGSRTSTSAAGTATPTTYSNSANAAKSMQFGFGTTGGGNATNGGQVTIGSSAGSNLSMGSLVLNASGNAAYTFVNNTTTGAATWTLNTGGADVTAGYGIVVNSNVVGTTTFQTNAGGGTFGVVLGANQTWQNNSTSYALAMNVPVSGNFALTTNGTGAIILGGANSFNGLTVSSGTLRATNAGALGSGTVTVSSTATLAVLAAITKNISNSGTVSIGAGGNLSASSLGGAVALGGASGTAATFTDTLSGTLTLGSLAATGDTNISLAGGSQISASGTVSFAGSGNLFTLTGPALTTGTYTLIQAASLSGTSGLSLTGGGVGNATIALGTSALVGRNTYAFSPTATALQLGVTGTIFNLVWDNTVSSGTWNDTSAVWLQSGTGSPIAFVTNDNVTFGSAATIAVPANVSPGTMAISNATGSVAISGAGAIAATSLTKSGAGTATIANAATFANGLAVNAGTLTTTGSVNVTAGGLTVAGGIYSGSAATTISLGGITVSSGTATLGAASSITGGIAVSGGRLALNAANTVSGSTSVTGGILAVGANGALGSGTATLDGGTLAATASGISVAVPVVVGAAGGTVNNDAPFTLSGAITGSSNVLTKTGSGALTISGALGTTAQGVTVNVNAGSLTVTGAGVKEFGGTSTLNGDLTLDNATVYLSQNGNLQGTGTIYATGASSITRRNSASGGSSTISNALDVSGTFALNSSSGKNIELTGLLSGAGSLTLGGAGKVTLSNGTSGGFSGPLTIAGSGVNGYAEITTQAVGSAASIVVSSNASRPTSTNLSIANTTTGTLAAVISGPGNVAIAAGTARPVLSGSNTNFTGLTLVAGDVGITNLSALGTGTVTATASGARVFWDATSGSTTFSNPLSTGTQSTYALAFAGTGKTWTPTGGISGSGQLKVSGGAVLDLTSQTGVTSTYTGGLEIGTGSVIVSAAGNLGSGGGAVNFGTGTASFLVVGGTGTNLTLSNPFTIGSSAGNGYTANIDTNGNTLTITSAIANKAGNANGGLLTKQGLGSLILSGSSTYTGTTTVTAGELIINGLLDPASPVNVASGATLGGTGSVGGTTVVSGIVAPGSGGIGTLSVASTLTWNGAASAGAATDWAFQLGSSTTSDLLAINGGASDFLKGTGGVFRFDFGNSVEQGTFRLVSWGGTTSFSASDFSYTGLANGNTATFSIDGQYLNVIIVPEPATVALVCVGAAGLAAGMRRIRRR